MREPFVPHDFIPPQTVSLGEYMFSPTRFLNTYEDWIVITNNADAVVKQRGGGSRKEWPYTCILEENAKDLAWLEICATYKQLFSYIMRNKDTHAYCGMVYIYPIELFYPEKADKYDVDLTFWITKEEFNARRYEEVFKNILHWLEKDWPFRKEKIYLRNALIPKSIQRQYSQLIP